MHRLSHPTFKIPRTYRVKLNKPLHTIGLRQLRNGIELEDGPVGKVKLEALKEHEGEPGYWYEVTITVGRKRIIRRMFLELGFYVERLIRIRFGDLTLDRSLKPGQMRSLTGKEVRYLKKNLDLN